MTPTDIDPTTVDSSVEALDPEILERMARRAILRRGAAGLAAAAASSVGFAALAQETFAQGTSAPPKAVVDVLNFALTLEYLESSYYDMGTKKSGLIPKRDREIFTTIAGHETKHVAFLKQALGAKAVKKPNFDFTAGGKFDPFGDYMTFRLLSYAFEDTGVRAYKGQAIVQAAKPLLRNPTILTAALTIHSVEARHAARVRQLLGLQAWIPTDQPDAPAPVKPVYATDSSLKGGPFDVSSSTEFGVDVAKVSGVAKKQVTEAFDQPLGMDAVLKIAGLFIKS